MCYMPTKFRHHLHIVTSQQHLLQIDNNWGMFTKVFLECKRLEGECNLNSSYWLISYPSMGWNPGASTYLQPKLRWFIKSQISAWGKTAPQQNEIGKILHMFCKCVPIRICLSVYGGHFLCTQALVMDCRKWQLAIYSGWWIKVNKKALVKTRPNIMHTPNTIVKQKNN